MEKRTIQHGRPTGGTTYEAAPAKSFGMAVRAMRVERGLAQETLANIACIERSHFGKIERGEHMPTLMLIIKIARALNCTTSILMERTEENLRLLDVSPNPGVYS